MGMAYVSPARVALHNELAALAEAFFAARAAAEAVEAAEAAETVEAVEPAYALVCDNDIAPPLLCEVKSKARKYFTLISRGPDDTRWAIEFGDYKRGVVKQERDDMKDGDYCDHAFRIIETDETQEAINAAVDALNRT